MDGERLKQDVAERKLGVEQLVKILLVQQEQIEKQQAEIRKLQKQLAARNPTARLDEQYSAKAEEKRKSQGRRAKRRKPLRRGRLCTADKIKLAQRTESVYPDGVPKADCKFSHTRVAWRLEHGRALLIAYDIYRYGNQFGKPRGLLGRSEYGIEIVIAIAYQVYGLGLSIDKACAVLSFFQQLKLRKSQADALLNRLARCWESEFDTLCTLLANSAVVQCDETSWSRPPLRGGARSVWAFLNDKLTVLFYGVHKDGQTLKEILDKDVFDGVLISDDAAVYQGFNKAQKCWAHLIRKAIKLTLQSPANQQYRDLTDRLLEIYRKAKQIAADGRLREAGRAQRVAQLDDEVLELCAGRWIDESTDGDDVENDYRRLCNELMRLMLDQELFVFVATADVEGNNNASERQLRGDALARKTGRTSKTPRGAKRQSIISSVLQSVGKQLESFTLERVIDEIQVWMIRGRSRFKEQVEASGLSPPARNTSLLDRLILEAD